MSKFTTIDIMLETLAQPQPGMPALPHAWKSWLYIHLTRARKELTALENTELLEVCKMIVEHANKRQRIATVGMEDEELSRLSEPPFVELARSALTKAEGHQ